MKFSLRIRLFLLKCALAMLPLLLMEGIARACHSPRWDVHNDKTRTSGWYVYSPELLWEKRPGFRGDVYEKFRQFGANGLLREDQNDLSRECDRRIVLIGDSCTFGYKVSTSNTYAEALKRRMPSSAVINLATPGYTSFQGLVLLRECIQRLKPDIVVISFNYNDRRYILDADHADSAKHFRKCWFEAVAIPEIEHISCAFKWLRFEWHLHGPQYELPEVVDVAHLKPRVGLRAYRQNLLQMAQITHGNGAVPVFLAFGDNPTRGEAVRQGIAQFSQGAYGQAIEQLQRASSTSNEWTALARTYLCRALSEEPAADRSTASTVDTTIKYQASLHGGHVIETDLAYQDIAREVASEGHMIYVDAARELNQHPEVYIDICHFNAQGHQLVADALAPVLESLPVPRKPAIH